MVHTWNFLCVSMSRSEGLGANEGWEWYLPGTSSVFLCPGVRGWGRMRGRSGTYRELPLCFYVPE